jgi:hypothetical protein
MQQQCMEIKEIIPQTVWPPPAEDPSALSSGCSTMMPKDPANRAGGSCSDWVGPNGKIVAGRLRNARMHPHTQ